jgi:hypothetical protein
MSQRSPRRSESVAGERLDRVEVRNRTVVGPVQDRGDLGVPDVQRECSFIDCDNPARSGGQSLCEGHYSQQRRGQPLRPLVYGIKNCDPCLIDGCEKPGRTRGLCAMHDRRMRVHGDPDKVIPHKERAWRHAEEHQSWIENPTYNAVHRRLRKYRGKATEHLCGCGAQAQAWAYVGVRDGDRPYSTNLDDYKPMCWPCHVEYDRNQLGRWTHCIHGHEFTSENTYIGSRGQRGCRRCKREKDAAYYRQRVPCPDCGKDIAKPSLPRHLRNVHAHEHEGTRAV